MSSQTCELTLDIVESLYPEVQQFDQDEENKLSLYCYTNSDDFNQNTKNAVKLCRGVIFSDEKIVLQAFSYTPDIIAESSNIPTIKNYISEIKDWNFYEAYEGTLLRLFYYKKRWFLSTHRKLDAFRSRWSSNQSFGALFVEALENEYRNNKNFAKMIVDKNPDDDPDFEEGMLKKFYTCLDTSLQYAFLLRNTEENRIVSTPPESTQVLHVGTFHRGKMCDSDINIQKPKNITFSSVEELVKTVENFQPEDLPGIICFGPNNVQIKIINKAYNYWFHIRGNQPSIKFRYLQLRQDHELCQDLRRLYPECSEIFDNCENDINNIAKSLYDMYKQVYIEQTTEYKKAKLFNIEYKIIQNCHNSYLANRRDKISPEKILLYINRCTPTDINHMLKRWKNSKNVEEDEKEIVPLLTK